MSPSWHRTSCSRWRETLDEEGRKAVRDAERGKDLTQLWCFEGGVDLVRRSVGVRCKAQAVSCEVGESEVRREAGYILTGGEQTSSPAVPDRGSVFTD